MSYANGCHICGAHPDDPRNTTQKLYLCLDCKSYTCHKHLAKPKSCPRCGSKKLKIAALYNAQSIKTRGSNSTESQKQGLFKSSGGGGGKTLEKRKDRAEKAANLATEIVKGIGAGVAEAVKILSEGNPKKALSRPEEGISVVEELHNTTVMSDGLQQGFFDERTHDHKTLSLENNEIIEGLIDQNDPLYKLSLLAEHTLDSSAFLSAPNQKAAFRTDAFIYTTSLFQAQRISQEILDYNQYHTQHLITVIALSLDPKHPDIAEKFCDLLENNPYLFGAIGVSPQIAHSVSLEEIDHLISHTLNAQEKIIALGPIGYDLHFSPTKEKEQGALLHTLTEIAEDFNLPIILEEKEAEKPLESFISTLKQSQIVLVKFNADNLHPINTKAQLKYLISINSINRKIHLENKRTKSIISHFIQNIGKKNILLCSGERQYIPVEINTSTRNQSAFTEFTLKKIQNLFKDNDIHKTTHALNVNFLKTFHPDLRDDEKES